MITTLLAGCQLVFEQQPPGAPPGDGDVTPRCVPSVPDVTRLGAGNVLTVDADAKVAARLPSLRDDAFEIAEGEIDQMNAQYSEAYMEIGATFTTLGLFPDGTELLAGKQQAASGYEIWRFVPEGAGSWVPQTPLTFIDEDSAAILPVITDRPGAPTATTARRMILSHGESGFDEFLEFAPDRWQRVRQYADGTLGNGMRDGNLSADGLLLVFVIKDAVGDQIMVSEREAVTDAFSTAIVIYEDQLLGEVMPYMTNDCKSLFYTGVNRTTGAEETAVAKFQ